MKKHGFDRDGFLIDIGDRVKFIGGCYSLKEDEWLSLVGCVFTITNIEPSGYGGSLGVAINGAGLGGWTNTWNLLKVVEE